MRKLKMNNKKVLAFILAGIFVFLGITFSKSVSASTEYTITSEEEYESAVETLNNVSDGTYYIYLDVDSIETSSELSIISGVRIYIYLDDDLTSASIISNGGSTDYLFEGKGGSLYIESGISCISDDTYVYKNFADSSSLYIESGATLSNSAYSNSEGTVYDNGFEMRLYVYGSLYHGFQTDGGISYLYYGYGCTYSSTLDSDYTNYYLTKYEVLYDPGDYSNESMQYDEWVVDGDTTDLYATTYTREYYTQEGWSLEEQTNLTDPTDTSIETKELEASLEVDSPILITPTWSADPYTISYNLNGGTNSSDNPETYYVTNGTITLSNPTYTGYTFVGWYGTSTFSGSKITEIDTTDPENIDLYACWSINTYNITYELNDGTNSADNPDSYKVTDNTIALSNPTKTGYTFAGWYEEEDFSGSKVTTIDTTNPKDITLYAKWTANDITISFNSNEGSSVGSITAACGSDISNMAPDTPTKAGYTFAGWYTDSDLTEEYTFDIMGNTSITLYAKWTAIDYAITYKLNGGTNNSNNPESYTIENSNITLSNPKRAGYTFVGWYTDSDFQTSITTITTSNLEGITIYAKWSANTITISFDSNGGSDVSAIKEDCDSDISNLEPRPKKDGYTFAGWYTDSELTDEYTFDTMGSSDITLYAKWTANSYTITFDSNEGSSVDSITADYETSIDAPSEPTRDGYVFAGWYTDSELTDEYTFDTMGLGDTTLYAKWVEVTTSDDSISVSVTDLTSVMSSEDLENLETVKVVVSTDYSDIDSSDESLIEDYISTMDNSSNIGAYYFNVTIYAVTENDNEYSVSEIQSQVSITITIDDDYTGYSSYGIIRCHDNETEELSSTYDSETNTISFDSNQFSTFAVYYVNDTVTTTSTINTTYIVYICVAILVVALLIVLIFIKVLGKASHDNELNDKKIQDEKLDIKNDNGKVNKKLSKEK